jgi:AraC family transcriptional regulator
MNKRLQERHADDGDFVRTRLAPLGHRGRGLFFATRTLALHAAISAAGFERQVASYDWHGIKRGTAEFVLFQYTIAGEGRLSYAGEQHVVRPGQAMVLHFPHDNRYWLPDGGAWEFFFLCLHGREVIRAWREIIAKRGPVIPLDLDSQSLALALDACCQVLQDEVRSQYQASALAYGLAMALLAETCDDATPAKRLPGIEAAREYARRHFAEAIGVDDLARASGYSRFHFSRLFAASEGVTPAAFVADLRIRAAARLLRDTEQSVGAIAGRCGFSDAAYFCRAFRNAVGVSPGEFRNSGMY